MSAFLFLRRISKKSLTFSKKRFWLWHQAKEVNNPSSSRPCFWSCRCKQCFIIMIQSTSSSWSRRRSEPGTDFSSFGSIRNVAWGITNYAAELACSFQLILLLLQTEARRCQTMQCWKLSGTLKIPPARLGISCLAEWVPLTNIESWPSKSGRLGPNKNCSELDSQAWKQPLLCEVDAVLFSKYLFQLEV